MFYPKSSLQRQSCLHSSVVERQSCKLKVHGSIPCGGTLPSRVTIFFSLVVIIRSKCSRRELSWLLSLRFEQLHTTDQLLVFYVFISFIGFLKLFQFSRNIMGKATKPSGSTPKSAGNYQETMHRYSPD